jgi:hypothetical protein
MRSGRAKTADQGRGSFRIDTRRRKAGSKISNVIPGWLGKQLLGLKNGNRHHFF